MQIWSELQNGIKQIFAREPSLTKQQYMDLYTWVCDCEIRQFWRNSDLCTLAPIRAYEPSWNLNVFSFFFWAHRYLLAFNRLVYNYCTSVQQNSNRNQVSQKPTKKSGGGGGPAGHPTTAGAQLVGQELYKRLKDFLEGYLIDLLSVSGPCAGKRESDAELIDSIIFLVLSTERLRFNWRKCVDILHHQMGRIPIFESSVERCVCLH